MVLVGHDGGRPPQDLITITQAPARDLSPQQSLKKEPYSTIGRHAFCHTLSLVASSSYTQDTLQIILQRIGRLSYARVYMKLIEIVSGAFFDEYIKTGNILMISEGRPGHDATFTLRQGLLRMEVDRPTFERLGVDGKPIQGQGRKHVKARYVIEVNLRSPSSVRGKKGFDRLLWAFKNVLNDSKAWLFADLQNNSEFTGPISAFAPIVRHITPSLEVVEHLSPMNFDLDYHTDKEDIVELQEWLSLITLESPRISEGDTINSYLCRYTPPQFSGQSLSTSTKVCKARWRGLVHPEFIVPLLEAILKNAPSQCWLSMSAYAFDGTGYTIVHKGDKIVVCDFKD